MKIKTINPVPNAYAFANQDCHVIARIPQGGFDLTTGTFTIIYEAEIPYTPAPGLETSYHYEEIKKFKDLRINPQEINALLASMETDLNDGYNYWENIQTAMHEVFRQKVGIDGRFGLTTSDWEKI